MKQTGSMKSILKKVLFALLGLLLVMAAALFSLYLWADTLYRSVLGGDAASAQESDYVTSFDLLAEETKHQTSSRIGGWLNYISSHEVSTNGSRGMLSATLYEPLSGEEGAPYAIVLHGGIGTDRAQVRDIACALSIGGYHVLTPDLYAHGASEGDASTLGFGDAQDVRAWIDYVERTQMGARIVLFGQDEGATAVLLAAGEGLSDSVAAVAADSACDDGLRRLKSLAGDQAGGVKSLLLETMFRQRTGMDDPSVSPIIGGAETPLLLIHGTGDQTVPAWQSEDIANAAGDGAQLLYIEGAGHGLSRYVDPDAYYDALLGFFKAALQ